MENYLLNIARFLQHADCLALEICCKIFRRVLVGTEFHTWPLKKLLTKFGYYLEYPNGEKEYETESCHYKDFYPTSTRLLNPSLIVISDFAGGTRWLTRIYHEKECVGFIYKEKAWQIYKIPLGIWPGPKIPTVREYPCTPCKTIRDIPEYTEASETEVLLQTPNFPKDLIEKIMANLGHSDYKCK